MIGPPASTGNPACIHSHTQNFTMQLQSRQKFAQQQTKIAWCIKLTQYLSIQLHSGERTGSRLLWSTTLLLPTLLSDSQVSISLVIHDTWSPMNRFRTGQGLCRANLHKWGLAQSPSCDCGQRQTANHTVDTSFNKIWRRTESTPRSKWWWSHMAGIYWDCSTH